MRGAVRVATLVCILVGPTIAGEIPAEQRQSGSAFMSDAARAMQNDDTSNPGMLSVLEGSRLWSAPAGKSERSCASCHGDATASMRGVAVRYPAYDERSGNPIDLAGRIDACRQNHQGAPALRREGDELLALTALVGTQSRGLAISPPNDPRLAPHVARGKDLFERRMGQLDLSCASCHDDNWSGRLGGSPITQAHPTGYPLYRLEWQALGSLQRRVRNCMVGVRAKPFDYSAQELIALELYLNRRAAGMPLETPGVRP